MRGGLRRLVAIGALSTAIDAGGFVALHEALGWALVPADAAALIVAAVASFVLHRATLAPGDPYERWVDRPAAFARIALVAGAVDVAVVVGLDALVGPATALALLFTVKVPALVVAGAVRLAGERRLLFRVVRAEQDERVDRGVPPGQVRLSVVVPAYRERDHIADAVAALREALEPVRVDGGLEIVIVDDGSGDGTADAARAAGADLVLEQPENRGKGAAVRRGVLDSHGRTVAFTDADLSYSPDQLLRLLAAVEDGWDVVVGSRRHEDTTTLVRAGRLRELGGRAINLLTQAVLLGQYRDTQCGLKAFRSDVAQLLFGRSRVDGFAFDVELFHLAERYRLSLTEVPVSVANSSRSTVRVARDALHLVRDLFRIRRWAKQGRYDEGVGAFPADRSLPNH
ncbi:MAG: glycosyltransferase [Acidimicrobiales bacterium]|nr:glycosyltransferase [Acidimicrobiales bacterium]